MVLLPTRISQSLLGCSRSTSSSSFCLYRGLASLSDEQKNLHLAPLYSLAEILCLAQQSGTMQEGETAELFGSIVEHLQKASTQADRNAATLDLVGEILARGDRLRKAQANGAAADDPESRELLLGSAPPIKANLGDETVTLDPSKTRNANFKQVLEMQKVPALSTLFTVAIAVRNLSSGTSVQRRRKSRFLRPRRRASWPWTLPRNWKLAGKEREAIQGSSIPDASNRSSMISKQKTARQKVNSKDLEKLAQEYWDQLGAPVRWALSGIVYAYFLRPDDLLVSEDPLLLRKHRFEKTPAGQKNHLFEKSEFSDSSQKAGSFFTGGFADFGDAAGVAAARGSRLGGESGEMFAAEQLSALRLTNWDMLREEDFRLLKLKVTVAREWIVRAATQPELEATLAETSLGLLSLTRRASLLNSLSTGDWRGVWNALTLSDVYFLADRYLERYSADPWQSPATLALRKAAAKNDGGRLQLLGAQYDDVFGCSHPHLWNAAPYEAYEKQQMLAPIAERSAEFKLYLAQIADAEGLPAASLGGVAETLARNTVLKRMQLNDFYDWRSVIKVYESMDTKMLREAMTKP